MRTFSPYRMTALAILAGSLSTSSVFAQAVGTPAPGANPTNTRPIDSKTNGANIRASQLIGMNIQNPEGQTLGEINDLVVNSRTGRIQYAAVTYGGFLGIGNKLFAVPFEAFQFRIDPNKTASPVLVLDISKAQLEGAVGFDKENWPDFANNDFANDLDRRYRVDRTRFPRDRDRDIDVNIGRDGVDVRVDGDKAPRVPK